MPISLEQFMSALSGQESGGSYDARNRDSGAYGRFQIMPSNWASWAQQAGLPPDAPQTPQNQEIVAAHKLNEYYQKFGNWEDVAAAWYSGSARDPQTLDRSQNGYPTIRQYVNSIMSKLTGGNNVPDSPPAQTQPQTTTGNGGLAGYIKSIFGNAKNAADEAVGLNLKKTYGGKNATSTGNFQTDARNYFIASQDAYDRLNKYIQNSKKILVVDAKSGQVLEYGADGSPTGTVDGVATSILQQAMLNEANLDRLLSMQKSGLIDNGLSAAQAYLKSENDKATEADRQYTNYVKRISDMAAIADIPNTQAATIASALNTINSANKNTDLNGSKLYGRFNEPMSSKTANSFADSIKSTLPTQAPVPHNIDPNALAPMPSADSTVPMQTPEQVLSSYTGQPQAVAPAPVSSTGPVQPIQPQPKPRWGLAGALNAGGRI